ncbi:KTSC domain-containing protein [Flavobacteriaceae bacterium]|nr:KTSC domain-containing protein [bacterium]MDB9913735.1 KTSC domain-containing protein [Flavobacteriaceae bacterium]
MKINILRLLFFLLIISCNSKDCKGLPSSFKSYEEELSEIKSVDFKFEDYLTTSKSSFIDSATYLSCDGINGYMIIEIKNTDYIYHNIPISLWNSFINANSFGTFYNLNIKGYKFKNRINNGDI